MYIKTKSILDRTEGCLLGLPSEQVIAKYIYRYAVYPVKYLGLGLGYLLKPARTWVLVAFVLTLLAGIIISVTELFNKNSQFLFVLCLLLPFVLVVFSVPSTFGYNGITDVHIEKIVNIIIEHEVGDSETIEALESNIELVAERVKSRISFYKWIIGVSWAGYIIAFNISFRLLQTLVKRKLNISCRRALVLFNCIYSLLYFPCFS